MNNKLADWREPIFKVKAEDEDVHLCNPDQLCACAEIVYKLSAPNELFSINSNSGEVFITEPNNLKTDREYILLVSAISNRTNLDMDSFNQFQLKVIIQEEFLGRVKRQVGRKKSKTITEPTGKNIENVATSFNLRTVSGEVNSLQVGGTIHYRLEIALPRSSLDLLLEIYTNDSPQLGSNKSSPALSIYNFTIPHRVAGISFNNPEPQYFLSNKSPNVVSNFCCIGHI